MLNVAGAKLFRPIFWVKRIAKERMYEHFVFIDTGTSGLALMIAETFLKKPPRPIG